MDLFNQVKQDLGQAPGDTVTLIFSVMVVVVLLIVGIPQILKHNVKGFVISVLAILFAAGGTYLLFLK